MPKLTIIDLAGVERQFDADVGDTVMRAAKTHDVAGILADCGGACACATCHIVVEPEWAERLPAAADTEHQMLEFALNREPTSRLACQIKVDESLDGFRARVASDQ